MRALNDLPASAPVGWADASGDERRAAAALAARVTESLDRERFVRDLAPLRALTVEEFRALLGRLVTSLATVDRDGPALMLGVERITDVVRAWHASRDGVALARLPIEMRGPWPAHRGDALAAALTFVEPADVVGVLLVPPPADPEEFLRSLETLADAAGRLGRVGLPPEDRVGPSLRRLARLLDRHEPVKRGEFEGAVPYPTATATLGPPGAASPGPGLGGGLARERLAHPLLAAPDRVRVEVPFEFRVGLAPDPVPGVVAPAHLALPAGPVDVTVNLNVSGFQIIGAVGTELTLRVREFDPYPSEVLRLTAVDDPDLTHRRTLQASYHIGGRLIGMAFRQVEVVAGDERRAAGPVPPAGPATAVAGWSLGRGAESDPDLYLIAGTTNTQGQNALAWTILSPHPQVPRSAEPAVRRIGRDDAEWLRGQYREIDSGGKDLTLFLRNLGRLVATAIPDQVWDAVRAVAAVTGPRPPTVLLATDEPHIPWELAQLPSAWQVRDREVLGAFVALGRWIVDPDRNQENVPPAHIEAATMAAVSGTYPHDDLPHARAEAARLVADYGAAPVTARKASVLEMLEGRPAADVVHFAVHGNFDQFDVEDGIVLVDGDHLSASEIGGLKSFAGKVVFLNACQLGQGHEVLGRYAGMMAAFLRLGALATIAPLWKVADAEAYAVGTGFYRAVLVDGVTPAEFLRRQRQASTGRESEPFGTRLAYLYFGHPRLRVTWAGATATAAPSAAAQPTAAPPAVPSAAPPAAAVEEPST